MTDQRFAERSRPLMLGVAAVLCATLAMAAVRPDDATTAVGEVATGPAEMPPVAAAASSRAEYLRTLHPAMAKAWDAAAGAAVEAAPFVAAPYVENGGFDAADPDARAYRVDLHAGETIVVAVATSSAELLHLELFDATSADSAPLARAERAADLLQLSYTAPREISGIIMLQPVHGADARYRLALSRRAALRFPVHGADAADFVGHFFDPRDGGARRHRGVDIRAPQGTTVLAAADGVIERVENTKVGGLVIWLQETGSPRRHYYAHLHTQLVRPGQHVRAGDPIGSVGRTGNAESTQPHLHFGLYDGDGVLNPHRYLRAAEASLADENATAGSAPGVVLLDGAAFRTSSDGTGRPHALARGETVTIVGYTSRFARVRLADGREGFVAAWLVSHAR